MKTLNQHNADQKATREFHDARGAGIACDVCKAEMVYTDLNTMMLSNPPMMMVTCENSDCKDFSKIKYKVM